MTILLTLLAILIICLYGFLFINSFQSTVNKDGLLIYICQCWLSGTVILASSSLVILLISFIGIKLGFIAMILLPILIFLLKHKNIRNNTKDLIEYLGNLQRNNLNKFTLKSVVMTKKIEIILILIFISFSILIITLNMVYPVSEWDCFMIWNLKSKLLFYDKIDLNFFTQKDYAFCQLDYPLLVPLMQSFISKIIGSYSETANKIFFSIMFISFSVMLNYYSSKLYKGYLSKLVIFPIILMFVLVWNFTNALADSTLMTFFLGVVVFLYFYLKDPENNRNKLMYVSIFALGCLMTKNEGLLLILSIFLTSILYVICFLNYNKVYLRSLITHFAIPLILNLPWILFIKLNHIVNVEGISVLSLFNYKMLNKSQEFFDALFYLVYKVFFSIGDWGILHIAFLILVVSAIFCKRTNELLYFVGTYILNLFVILLIYIQSPYGYAYHMGTSADRVILSMSPLVVCFVILLPTLIQQREQ